MLGPVQTLYESLNQFISLGGNDHINRQQTGSGREIRVTSRCQYHCECNMKRVRVERPVITLFNFTFGDHAAGKFQIDRNGLLKPVHQIASKIPLMSTQLDLNRTKPIWYY
jgi:hypothetical protein